MAQDVFGIQKKILIIEDEPAAARLAGYTLELEGYHVEVATNGLEGLKRALEGEPDLIVLDVMMPVMDGFEVLRKLRERPTTEAIPVVMLTAMWASAGELEALEFGVRHYISKPIDPDILQATVRVALRETETTATVAGNRGALDSPESPELIPLGVRLSALEDLLGGGIHLGSLTLLEGPSATGKSVLCQDVTSGAILQGHSVAYFASQHTPESLTNQVSSLGLDFSKYIQSGQLLVYPVQEPITGEDSGPLFATLASDMERIELTCDLIVVDGVTDLASTCQAQSVIGFFSTCKRLCSKGQTIQVVANSSAFDANLLNRVAALCGTHLNLSTRRLNNKVVRTIEAVKVNDVDLTKGNQISFEIKPGVGISFIPYSQAKA